MKVIPDKRKSWLEAFATVRYRLRFIPARQRTSKTTTKKTNKLKRNNSLNIAHLCKDSFDSPRHWTRFRTDVQYVRSGPRQVLQLDLAVINRNVEHECITRTKIIVHAELVDTITVDRGIDCTPSVDARAAQCHRLGCTSFFRDDADEATFIAQAKPVFAWVKVALIERVDDDNVRSRPV